MLYMIYKSQHSYKPMYKRGIDGRWHIYKEQGKDRWFFTQEAAYDWLLKNKCNGNAARLAMYLLER